MTKPVFTICEQQRRRSACASAQSDQHLFCSLPDSLIPILAKSKISRLKLASVTVGPCESHPVGNPKHRFSRDEAQMYLICEK